MSIVWPMRPFSGGSNPSRLQCLYTQVWVTPSVSARSTTLRALPCCVMKWASVNFLGLMVISPCFGNLLFSNVVVRRYHLTFPRQLNAPPVAPGFVGYDFLKVLDCDPSRLAVGASAISYDASGPGFGNVALCPGGASLAAWTSYGTFLSVGKIAGEIRGDPMHFPFVRDFSG
jgi:hypothetical protein